MDINDKNEMNKLEYIKGFDNYLINRKGEVFSTYSGMFMRQTINKNRYLIVNLRRNGKSYLRTIHRLMYETFRGKIHGFIRHLDGNTMNNNVDNLLDYYKSK